MNDVGTYLPVSQEGSEWQVDIDFCFINDLDIEISDYAKRFGITRTEVLEATGSGGGWPFVRFIGSHNAVRALCRDYMDDPAAEIHD